MSGVARVRITCVIDSLGSGGAQRQMAYLAVLLKRAGHDVQVVIYHDFQFYSEYVRAAEVPVVLVAGHRSRWGLILAMRREILRQQPNVVISFLNTPNLLAEFAKIIGGKFRLIVSERGPDAEGRQRKTWLRSFLHRAANVVVTNSNSQSELIRKVAPHLAGRVVTINNCVDMEVFHPRTEAVAMRPKEFRIVVVSSVSVWKNPVRFALGFAKFRQTYPSFPVRVDWYGNKFLGASGPLPYSDFQRVTTVLEESGLSESFQFHEPEKEVAKIYRSADVVCLPSLTEGCPNVICEAMACGCPILASSITDIPMWIEAGVNGFLFDPNSVDSIAAAIQKITHLTPAELWAMGVRNRAKAVSLFSFERFLKAYSQLLEPPRIAGG